MKETKSVNRSAGSTKVPQVGTVSLPVMKDGNEPPDMLLALLNNVLPSLINSQQAEIVGTGTINNKQATIIFFYGTLPTANKTLSLVGNVEAV